MTPSASRSIRAAMLCLVACALAAPVLADVTIRQKTVSSGLGGFADGTTVSALTVAGDRSRSEDEFTYTGRFKTLVGKKPKQSVTITRVDRELVWTLEPEKKQYREMTFAEMKEAMDKAVQEMEKAQQEQQEAQQQAGPSDQGMKFTVDVKKTGAKQDINGFACEQVIVTCIGKPEKPEPGAENAELRLVMDQWLSPAMPGQSELTAFYRRLSDAMGLEQQFAGMSAMARSMYGNAMKEMAAKFKDLKGYAVRSTFTVEGQGASPEQQAAAGQAKADAEKAREEGEKSAATAENVQDATDAATIGSQAASGQDAKGAIGGFLGRKLAGMAAKKAQAKAAKAAEGGSDAGGALFKVVTEVTSVSSGPAVAASFDVPEGFKKVEKK